MTAINSNSKLPFCHEIPLVPLACQDLVHATDLLEKCLEKYAQPCISTSTYTSPKKEKSTPPLAFLGNLLTLGMAGCGGDSVRSSTEIIDLEPLGDETAVSPPILGTVNGLAFAGNGAGGVVAGWSVENFDELESHGTFGVKIDGLNHYLFPDKVNSNESIPRETHVAALDDGSSVLLLRRVSDPEQPGQLTFQRFGEEGRKIGQEVEVAQTQGVGAKVVPLSEGFGVLYLSDSDSKLKLRVYNFEGQYLTEKNLDSMPKSIAIARGENGAWVLAALEGQHVEVKSFVGTEVGSINQRVRSSHITSDAKLSVGMAPNGSVMVAWNAIKENNTPFLQGIFLGSDGEMYNQGFDLQELTRTLDENGDVFINSHAIATDREGNFILALEQGGNFQVLSFRDGLAAQDPQRFINLTPDPTPVASEESFADFLNGLNNRSTKRDEVSIINSDGTLYLGGLVFLTGNENGITHTAIGVTYRPFEIVYRN